MGLHMHMKEDLRHFKEKADCGKCKSIMCTGVLL